MVPIIWAAILQPIVTVLSQLWDIFQTIHIPYVFMLHIL